MRALFVLLLGFSLPWLAACGSGSDGEPLAVEAPTSAESSTIEATQAVTETLPPTVVQRREPPPTATIDPSEQPLAPVTVDVLPGIVVPAAALLVDSEPATSDQDARADFTMADTDVDTLVEWFREQLALADWTLAEERDGALVFLHVDDLSARFAEEGLKRTASVFFDTLDDVEDNEVSFTIVAEAPKE